MEWLTTKPRSFSNLTAFLDLNSITLYTKFKIIVPSKSQTMTTPGREYFGGAKSVS